MAVDNHLPSTVYGPFCRLATTTHHQDAAAVVKQVLSGELWGFTVNGLTVPRVEAYGRALRDDESGVEFYALAAPDNRHGRPAWGTAKEHVTITVHDGREVAKLRVAFVRITQDLVDDAAAH